MCGSCWQSVALAHWNRENTVATRTEIDYTVSPPTTAVVTFGYDLRKRLISEIRQVGQQIVYNYEYEYDQLGNRRCEHDLVNSRMTGYVYDVDWDPNSLTWRAGLCYTPPADPNEADFPRNLEDFPTFHNRLLEYRVFDVSGETAVLLRTVRYAYWAYGHARNITIKDEWTGQGEPPAAYAKEYDLSLAYRTSGPLYMAIWGEYAGGYPTGYASSEAWEFRYDGGRERYLARRWDASDADPNDWVVDASMPATWTDYLGENPAVDYTVAGTPPAATPVRRYLAGYGVHAQADSADEFEPVYLHGDLIRSTVMMTDAGGQALATTAYTAFGEPISEGGVGVPPANFDTRYAYAGGHGYESGLISLQGANTELPPITLQHVGARWYQPGIGRFVQRDPIGIDGGVNVYEYCGESPLSLADPLGFFGWNWNHFAAAIGGGRRRRSGARGAGRPARGARGCWSGGGDRRRHLCRSMDYRVRGGDRRRFGGPGEERGSE